MCALRPGQSDVSRPVEEREYAYKKQFYQDDAVAEDYDEHRFKSRRRATRNRRKWAAIRRALDTIGPIRLILDIPCGTGRFTPSLVELGYEVIGGDISLPMMRQAKRLPAGEGLCGFVQADAEHLPFADDAVDCVMSIRFMHHIDSATRVSILREMARISRRWLIVDYRHRYSMRFRMRAVRLALGLTRRVLPRISRDELQAEFGAAGVRIAAVIPVGRFSDKWIVVGDAAPR